MNLAAVFHHPMSEYAFAMDENTYVFRLRAQRGDLKRCTLHYADRAAMTPELDFQRVEMPLWRSDKLYDWFEVTLKCPFERIAYHFELDDGSETCHYAGDCFEKDPSMIQRSEHFQLPYNHRADRLSVPDWTENAVVYNIFPDSFADGRRSLSCRESEADFQGEKCLSRLGGTLDGIRENLDYLRELGFNCLYLNPIFAASSYHKYDTLDYFRIDPTRGTEDDFRALVQEAHRLGLRVLIDGVFNHIGWKHPFFQDVLKRGKASPYWSWFYALPEHPCYPDEGEMPEYACFSYVPQMPKTDTSCPEMRDYFCNVGAYWVREFDVDGWRLDVANEMDDGFLRAFREAVKREKPDALVIGEVWENAAHFVNHGLMDGAMNYDFRRFCRQFFAEGSIDAAEFDLRLSSLLTRYPRQMLSAQLNLLDSHDVSRFLTLCGGDRAWMEQAVLFQMAFPGMPCVFYGDEKGLEGTLENEYRRPMAFDRSDALEDVYRRMIALRKEHPALRHGDFQTLLARERLFVCRRSAPEENLLLCWNAGEKVSPVPGLSEEAVPLLQKGWNGGLLEGRGYAVFQTERR